MPELTIHLTDRDFEVLEQKADPLGLTARRMAERLIHRTLAASTKPAVVTHKQRSADRAVRQLELLRLLRRRHFSTLTQTDKRALAERFGVNERTIYRDIDVLLRTRGDAPLKRAAPDPLDLADDSDDQDTEGWDEVPGGSVVRGEDEELVAALA